MQAHSSILRSALSSAALAALAACGGGGDDVERRAAPGAGVPPVPATTLATSAGTPGGVLSAAATVAAASSSPVVPGAALLDPLVASRLQTELDHVEQGLRLVSDTDPAKREALEVIRELRAELDKDHPNRLRVRGLAGGLAHGVQVLEGWKGAGKFLPQLIPLV